MSRLKIDPAESGPPCEGNAVTISYRDSKDLARSKDPSVRSTIAERNDAPPEVLFFLAGDPDPNVRGTIASNPASPSHADQLLAEDKDVTVRGLVAGKIARLLPRLTPNEKKAAEERLLAMLELLVRDQAEQVRQILSEALKDQSSVPGDVIRHLARDTADLVALPVLECSPLLDDDELVAIINEDCASNRLCAISRRQNLGAFVADAVVGRNDEAAITALLKNKSAQIREETLDGLVERAGQIAAWQGPLIERPALSPKVARSLAGCVARSLLGKLQARDDLSSETAAILLEAVRARLEREGPVSARSIGARDDDDPSDSPNETMSVQRAVITGDRDAVVQGLAARSAIPPDVVERILASRNPKAVVALTWKADLTMRFAVQLQLRLCGIAPEDLINPGNGPNFPHSENEMRLKLEFFATV